MEPDKKLTLVLKIVLASKLPKPNKIEAKLLQTSLSEEVVESLKGKLEANCKYAEYFYTRELAEQGFLHGIYTAPLRCSRKLHESLITLGLGGPYKAEFNEELYISSFYFESITGLSTFISMNDQNIELII